MGMNKEPKLFQRKRRVYCRLLADGTCVGPAHTRAFLRHLVWVHRMNEAIKAAKADRAARLRGEREQ